MGSKAGSSAQPEPPLICKKIFENDPEILEFKNIFEIDCEL
jgi:hypothetical protein